jgi:hypothetical protein
MSKPQTPANPVGSTAKRALLAALAPHAPEILDAKPGANLTLVATVKNAMVAYNLSYDGNSVLFRLVSGTTTIPVGTVGTHSLRWAFNETPAEGWEHRLTAQIDSLPSIVLVSGSAANNDPPLVHDHAFIVVS